MLKVIGLTHNSNLVRQIIKKYMMSQKTTSHLDRLNSLFTLRFWLMYILLT